MEVVTGAIDIDRGVVGAVDSINIEVVGAEIVDTVEFIFVELPYFPSRRTHSAIPWSEELIYPRTRYSRGNFWEASARARAQTNALNVLCIANSTCSY